jgi:hypothetical protein
VRFKGLVLAAGVALGLILVVSPPTSAFAIGQVECGDRTDVVRLGVPSGADQCFADTGVRGVNVEGVETFYSGNNKAMVNYEHQGRYHAYTLEPQHSFSLQRVEGQSHLFRVYEVRIF